MPYKARGKCVYKGNKKVGCTKGSVKKYLTALRIHREMVTADVGVGGTATDIGKTNTDSYAPGDARIPKVFGGVIRRPGMSPKKKKKTIFESKFIEHIDNDPIIIDSMLCVTRVTNKNLMRVTEDIVQMVTPDYDKTIFEDGSISLEFVVNEELMTEFANRINGLLGDRLNKSVFVQLEKITDPSELKTGIDTEKEHSSTIKKIKKDPSIPVNKAAEMIARDHLGEHPKYYSKLTKAKL